MMWTVKLFLCCLALRFSQAEENIELEIAQGKLRGLKNTTVYHGVPFYSFRGIPYAEPNVGRDRFNVAVPLDNWSGTLNATRHGNACACLLGKKMMGNEDCLFLNVYTLDLNTTANRAVMVYIHGGAFIFGSGNDWPYGPDFLVEKDIVLVTMNYRLGVIGFLNTGDLNAPGNIGLKDQNLALKWVQTNIIHFGGSPNRVTIFGQSAGAASVHYHILSPMSKGLFKGAILQSGASINPWAFTRTPQANAMSLANILGINVTDSTELVEKLKDTSLVKLLTAARHHFSPKMLGFFAPSVEVNAGQEIFLPDDPWKIMTSANISDVPVMMGITENEFGFMAMRLVSTFASHKDSLSDLIPPDLNVTDDVGKNSTIENIRQFYFNGLPEVTNFSDASNLYNDMMINNGLLFSAGIMNARMSSPVYEYLFNFNTSSSLLKHSLPIASGVVHSDELGLLFYIPLLNNVPQSGSLEEQKLNEMLEMWTNFAKKGDPSVTMEAAKIKWEPMADKKNYLDIGSTLGMKYSLFQDRVAFWAGLYSDIIGDYMKLFN